MTAIQTMKTGAATVGILLLMAAPFGAMYVYDQKFDSPAAREARITKRFNRTPATSDSAPSGGADSPIAAAPNADSVGCWAVASRDDGGKLELGATWHAPCPVPQHPTLSPGEYQLPSSTFYLSAWGAGTPDLARAQGRATLSPEVAEAADTPAGLLFLPVTQDGRGYYLAAWQQQGADGAELQGMQVGYYGAPPPSVSTPVGRIYMDAPTRLVRELDGAALEAEPEVGAGEQDEPSEG